MKITSIQLRNFKRFSDLSISEIPKTAKLVVVVGPNGCGKSSLFDAFLHWYRGSVGFGYGGDDTFYRKSKDVDFQHHDSVIVSLADAVTPKKGCLYVRTAHRNDPDFSISGISKLSSPSEEFRVSRSIDNDQVVSQNYQRLVYDTIAGVYEESNKDKSVGALKEELIGALGASMAAVFGDLTLNSIADPLSAGTFRFDKGVAKSYNFKNLSGGEKAAFDLLLDLHVKKKYFASAIYCIDELETHLHTRVQGLLLKEMVKVLPEEAQLWVTTHSLGVLRAAQELAVDEPDSVCVIDFDGINPDEPTELRPSNLGRVAWGKMLSIAIDDLSLRVAPKTIVICEGADEGAARRKNFDADVYSKILGSQYPDVQFLSGGSAHQVASSALTVRAVLKGVLPSTKVYALRNRDDMSETEIESYEAEDGIVLSRRHLESFLLDDEVLTKLTQSSEKSELTADVLKIKNGAIAQSVARGNPKDDLKSASGEIYTKIKILLGLTKSGNSADSFIRDTLAPLVSSDMKVYKELESQIIHRTTN